jgi:hypothetical protein
VKLNAERMQRVVLSIIPLAFNELGSTDALTVADGARCRTEGGGGFTFAVAGEDDQNAFCSVAAATRVATCVFSFCWR